MAATFLQLKQRVAVLAQRVTYDVDGNATYDDVFLAQAGVWIQLAEKLLAEIYDYWTELQGVHNFTTGDGTETYSMPSDFDKPLRVYDLTNEKQLTPITEEEYFDSNISAIADADEGKPDKYRIFGVSSRLKQMKLGKIPDDAYSVRVLYKKVPAGMSANDDYAFIDADRYLIFDSYGYALKQAKEDMKANFAWEKAKEALQILLNNQMTKLSPKYQHKITSRWLQAHRA